MMDCYKMLKKQEFCWRNSRPDAIDMLNDCLSFDIDTSLKRIAKNLKLTYTKKLLENISTLLKTDLETWFCYFLLLFMKVPDEVESILEDHPDMKKTYSEFIDLWRKEAIEQLRSK
jgi:hypothetical protein